MSNFSSNSSADYTSAMNNYNRLNSQYEKQMGQYTGNAGYRNSLVQAAKGAGSLASGMGAAIQNNARNAGMNKAQAAAMGAGGMNNAYANQFNNQQVQAATQGQNALNATSQVAGNNLQGANMESNEQQNRYQRAWGNLGNGLSMAGAGINAGTNMFQGMFQPKAGSDEKLKDSVEAPKDISKCLSDIDAFLFRYTDKAKEEKPELTDEKEHLGLMAQDMEQNPVLENAVETQEDGTKAVDIKTLTMDNTALLSDLAKRFDALEGRLNELFPLGKKGE